MWALRVTEHNHTLPQFYLTTPAPCPYVPGRMERKVFTHLTGTNAGALNDALTHGGFRRSQNIAYKPACEQCSACVSIRIVTDAFRMRRSHKRILRINDDIEARRLTPAPTSEQYSLFRDYIDTRHADGGMADMTVLDYAMMVEDSSVETYLTEYRIRPPGALEGDGAEGQLVGVTLQDVLADGLSMVYSFFDPEMAERGLGTFMILDHVDQALRRGLPFLYLGYWISDSPKMSYKARFQPQEHLTARGWIRAPAPPDPA